MLMTTAPTTDIGGRYVRRYYYYLIIVVNVRNEKHKKNPRVISAGLQRMRASEPIDAKRGKDMESTRTNVHTNTIYHTINWAV